MPTLAIKVIDSILLTCPEFDKEHYERCKWLIPDLSEEESNRDYIKIISVGNPANPISVMNESRTFMIEFYEEVNNLPSELA